MTVIRLVTLLLAMLASHVVFATNASIRANVTQILIDDTYYGGCMAQFTEDPAVALPGCSASWLTFDCLAAFPETTKSMATNKLSQAQLALLTGRAVSVSFTDSRKASGYCFVYRIDLSN